jgi:hypothetical protein
MTSPPGGGLCEAPRREVTGGLRFSAEVTHWSEQSPFSRQQDQNLFPHSDFAKMEEMAVLSAWFPARIARGCRARLAALREGMESVI